MRKNDIAPASKSKPQPLRKGPGIKILVGLVLIGTSLARILYEPPMGDPNQEIGAKTAILGLLIAGIYLMVSGINGWKKN